MSRDESNEDDETCPLCLEEFDATDKAFTPCRCGRQFHCVPPLLNSVLQATKFAFGVG